MTKRIFRGILAVSCVTLLASIALIMGILYQHFSDELMQELSSEAYYIGQAVEAQGMEYLEQLSVPSGKRVTWIAADGTVLYDSSADPETMENHAGREEVQDAMQTGRGESIRYSKTLSERTMYYALRLNDDTILRTASTQFSAWVVIISILQPILLVFAVALALSAVLAAHMSKRIIQPINDLDLNHPDIEDQYEEFSPLLTKLNRQNRLIHGQMNSLRRQQEEFRIITENMNEGLLVFDQKTDLLSYNSAALRLLGATEPEENVSVLSLNRGEAFRTAVEESLSGKHSVQNLETEDHCYQIIANPVYQDAKQSGAVIVILDVTEKELRERLRREFTSNVSHELKTPLTSISGLSELIMNGSVAPDDTEDFARSIHEESARLITLVNDILKLSQLDENLVPAPKETVDLYLLSQSVIEQLRTASVQKKVTFALTGEHVTVTGVPMILEEMIYNLCDNAIKYNRPDGSVSVSVTQVEGHPQITVTDTGIGIPKEHLDRVFERFYRVDKSHSKKIGGTGLGLSIVKHGAAYHNATVSIQSTVGKGTSVTVLF